MNINLLKLWKQMLQLAEIETDKAKLIVESELAEGVEVFVEKDGEFVPAEDGEYATEDKVIVVAEGKVVEIRDKEDEQKPEETEQEQEPVELSANKQKFNAIKAQFEVSYQEIQQNIYSALSELGIWGYLIENGENYAIVSIWDEASDKEHLFRYDISIAEDGKVTLGESKEVRIEYVPVDEEPKEDEGEAKEIQEGFEATIAEKDARIAELESALAEKQSQLEMSADEPAKEKVKKLQPNFKF